jgi:hypothetical protein
MTEARATCQALGLRFDICLRASNHLLKSFLALFEPRRAWSVQHRCVLIYIDIPVFCGRVFCSRTLARASGNMRVRLIAALGIVCAADCGRA